MITSDTHHPLIMCDWCKRHLPDVLILFEVEDMLLCPTCVDKHELKDHAK